MIATLPEADGRRRRGHGNRARIVAALLELMAEGDVAPGAEAVAARAGVGLRTVFRHFRDMDSLYGAMAAVIEGRLADVVAAPLRARGWRRRVLELVARRAKAFETIDPYQRAAAAHRHRSAYLRAGHARLAATQRARLFAELPAGFPRLDGEALDLLLSFEAWSRLRHEQGLSAEVAEAVVAAAAARLIGARLPPPDGWDATP